MKGFLQYQINEFIPGNKNYLFDINNFRFNFVYIPVGYLYEKGL